MNPPIDPDLMDMPWHDVAVELTRLRASHAELLAACVDFVLACDTAPPVDLIRRISVSCALARSAIATASTPSEGK